MSSSVSAPSIDKCANCGKGEENCSKLQKCGACLSVKYCSKECQAAHRKQHKQECKKRAAEIYDEQLFREHPPLEECPICMLPLSFENQTSIFKSCCGKLICDGCVYAMKMSERKDLCAFCRMPKATSEEEEITRLNKLMDKGNGEAFQSLGGYYGQGLFGLPQDWEKAAELWLKAGELGCAFGYYNLGVNYSHGLGVEVDLKKAKQLYELAAISGHIMARHNLGALESRAGNEHRAMKHMMISARAGYKKSLDYVKAGYMDGFITKVEYANTIRAFHERQQEMKSDMRDKAAVYMRNRALEE